ncbi:MAG: DUF4230 domain-containing protein [Chitinophagaceae bacterium]
MTQTFRLVIGLIVIIALILMGYGLGRRKGASDVKSQLIENYSFVRQIAELASLEVEGVTTFKSTNLANDGSISDRLKQIFTEQTVHLSIPYTAKYGVNLKDSSMHITKRDSVLEIDLPPVQLLSFELRIDKLDATSRAGLLSSAGPDLYMDFQKQLYAESRAQLAQNATYLAQTEAGIAALLKEYFKLTGLTVVCQFENQKSAVKMLKG